MLPKRLWYLIRTHDTRIVLSTLKVHQENQTFIKWEFTSYNNQHLHSANLRWLQKPYAITSLTNETNEKKNPTRSNCFTDNNSFSKLVIFRDNTNRKIIAKNTMISHYQPENTYYVIRHWFRKCKVSNTVSLWCRIYNFSVIIGCGALSCTRWTIVKGAIVLD